VCARLVRRLRERACAAWYAHFTPAYLTLCQRQRGGQAVLRRGVGRRASAACCATTRGDSYASPHARWLFRHPRLGAKPRLMLCQLPHSLEAAGRTGDGGGTGCRACGRQQAPASLHAHEGYFGGADGDRLHCGYAAWLRLRWRGPFRGAALRWPRRAGCRLGAACRRPGVRMGNRRSTVALRATAVGGIPPSARFFTAARPVLRRYSANWPPPALPFRVSITGEDIHAAMS